MTVPASHRKRDTRLLEGLARLYLGFALRTTRWTITGNPDAARILTQHESVVPRGAVVAFWHQSLLLLPALWSWAKPLNPALRLRVLISQNKDGRLINETVAPWGIIGIEGSSDRKGKNKGGARALRRSLAALRDGNLLAITPDGPRGPPFIVQQGAMALVHMAKCPIVPVGGACTSLRLPTWDRLAVPLPFGRGELIYGAPLDATAAPDDLAASLADTTQRAHDRYSLGRWTMADAIWATLGMALIPFLRAMTYRRLRRGRELPGRLMERRGRATQARPSGLLLWLHAASVGECRSALPLIDSLMRDHASLNILVTTATVTGSEIVAHHKQTCPPAWQERLRHQFIPYDVFLWVRRFLRHWRPSALILIDSEIWPGVIRACFARAIPVAILNGRLSDRSWRRWRRFGAIARALYARVGFIAARGTDDAAHFASLGARDVACFGDLKQAAPPLDHDGNTLRALQEHFGDRPIFLAASTHAGEDEKIAEAATLARATFPDLLTIIVPRHPERGASIAAMLNGAPRRALGQTPSANDSYWVADTLNEMGLFYTLADAAFIGNSLLPPGGGHNPFEPVRAGTPIATGPHIGNFSPSYQLLEESTATVREPSELAAWLVRLLETPDIARAVVKKAQARLSLHDRIPASLLTRIEAMLFS